MAVLEMALLKQAASCSILSVPQLRVRLVEPVPTPLSRYQSGPCKLFS